MNAVADQPKVKWAYRHGLRMLPEGYELKPTEHVLHELDAKAGDYRLIWDSDSKDEVKAAKDSFESLKKKNYLAFKVKKDGSKGKAIDEFDPGAERIILSPQLQGG